MCGEVFGIGSQDVTVAAGRVLGSIPTIATTNNKKSKTKT
jgi:hypothetical protein